MHIIIERKTNFDFVLFSRVSYYLLLCMPDGDTLMNIFSADLRFAQRKC